MLSTNLDQTYATLLLEHQDRLQTEARQVVATLDLMDLLAKGGTVELVGSFAWGLMVRRDLDVRVCCPTLNIHTVLEIMRPLFAMSEINEIHYRHYNPTGLATDERFYFYIFYQEWKIDIAFWLAETWRIGGPRDYAAYRAWFAERLNNETKLAILWIKDIWAQRNDYPTVVSSKHIHDAVLNHRVRNPVQFEKYLREQNILTGR